MPICMCQTVNKHLNKLLGQHVFRTVSFPNMTSIFFFDWNCSFCFFDIICLFYWNIIKYTAEKLILSNIFNIFFILDSSFSATAAVNHHQTLCQWEGNVKGWLHQQCFDQDWRGVVRQRSNPTILPGQEVNRKSKTVHYRQQFVFIAVISIFLRFFSTSPSCSADTYSPKPSSLALSDAFLGTPITMTSKRKSR